MPDPLKPVVLAKRTATVEVGQQHFTPEIEVIKTFGTLCLFPENIIEQRYQL